MNCAEVETIVPPKSFDTHHDDHDAKVDFYGRRLATASSDRTIRIFQINENEPETLLSILSGHEGPVWQVAWAHPKFGSILASCSYDGSVIIWQEDKQQKSQNPMGTHSTWTKIKVHRVHDSSVNSICFAPHAYGLHLACASSDGNVSILSQIGEEWQSKTISAHSSGCNSVSWCPSSIPSTLLALDFNALEKKPVPLGPKMIATGGCDNTVKIWKAVITAEEGGDGAITENWELESTLDDHSDWVRDVCWRPNMGQVGHLLASCSQDNTVLLWRYNSEEKKWKSKKLKPTPFPETLWRVSFSEYGHLLAVSCGDNTVTLWREKAEDGTWELVGNVDETVTEAAKIDEPLAVEPPPSVPIPEINFNSVAPAKHVPKIAADVGYMKPMSPMMPVPSASQSLMSPGYNQVDQAYDNFQHAQVPTIPVTEPPTVFQSHLLSNPVIPDYSQTEHNYESQDYSYQQAQTQDYPEVQAQDYPVNQDFSKTQNYPQTQDFSSENNHNVSSSYVAEDFNKDIGFITQSETATSAAAVYESYEQPQQPIQNDEPSYDSQQYEQSSYDQQTYDQSAYPQYDKQGAYEQVSYEQSQYEQQTSYDQTQYEQPSYDHPSYDQTHYEQGNFEQAAYEQPTYEQPSYVYEPPQYEVQPEETPLDNTLQYEGYQTAPPAQSNNYNDAVNF